jgi:hypothetical protein
VPYFIMLLFFINSSPFAITCFIWSVFLSNMSMSASFLGLISPFWFSFKCFAIFVDVILMAYSIGIFSFIIVSTNSL